MLLNNSLLSFIGFSRQSCFLVQEKTDRQFLKGIFTRRAESQNLRLLYFYQPCGPDALSLSLSLSVRLSQSSPPLSINPTNPVTLSVSSLVNSIATCHTYSFLGVVKA